MADVDFDDLIPQQPAATAPAGDLSFDDLIPKKPAAPPPVAPGSWNDPAQHSRFGQAAMGSLMTSTADILDTEREAEKGILGGEAPVSKYVTGPAADWLKQNAPRQPTPASGTLEHLEDLAGGVAGGFTPGAIEYAGKVPFAAFHGYKTAEDEARAQGHDASLGDIAKDVVLEAGARKLMGLIENAPVGRIKKALGFGSVTGAEDLAEGKDKQQAAEGATVNALLGAILPGGHGKAREAPAGPGVPPDANAPLPTRPDVPTPTAAPEPGDVIGVKFPNAPSQRAQVDSYWDDGNSVRVRFDDGTTHDMLTHEMQRDRTEPPPPLNEQVRGPEGAGVPPTEAERFNIWDEADREAPYPDSRTPATPLPLGQEALDGVRRADALEQQANDPNSRMTDEQRNDALMAAQRLRAQYGHVGAPVSIGPEEQAALDAARAARGPQPDDSLVGNERLTGQPNAFTPEEIEAARQNRGTTGNILGQEVPNIDPAPGQFSPEEMAAAQQARQEAAQQRAEAAAAAEADKRAAAAAAKPEAAAPLIDAQGNQLPTADGRSTLLVPVPPRKALTLMQWIRGNGGIKDTDGDLGNLFLSNGKKPPPGIIANKNGQPADVLVQRAREAGYFPEVPNDPMQPDELTGGHLLEAIEAELNGQPKYSENDRAAVDAHEAAKAYNENIKNLSGLHGVDFRGVSRQQFDAAITHAQMIARAGDMGIELKGSETPAEVQNLVQEREAATTTEPAARSDLADRIERETTLRFGQDFPENRDEIPWIDEYEANYRPGFEEPASGRASGADVAGQEPGAGEAPVGGRAAQVGEAGAEAARPASGLEQHPAGWATADATVYRAGPKESTNQLRDFYQFAADADHTIDSPHASNVAASEYTLSRGSRDGNEHAVSVDARTGEVLDVLTSGETNRVAFTPELMERMQDPDADLVLHHNHPRSTGQSPVDTGALGLPGVRDLVVTGHDGEISASRLSPEYEAAKAEKPGLFKNNVIGNIATRAWNAVYNALAAKVRSGLIDPALATQLHADLTNHALAAAGVIDHIGTRDLSDLSDRDIAHAIEAGAHAASLEAYRNGLPIRSEEDVRLYRPPTGVRPDRALEEVSRRASEAAAARSADTRRNRAGAGNDQVEGNGQAAPRVAPEIEKTDQGDQYVMPGAERSAVQAATARGDLMRSAKPQKPADMGMFAKPDAPQPDLFSGPAKPAPETDLFGNTTPPPKQAPIQGKLFEGGPDEPFDFQREYDRAVARDAQADQLAAAGEPVRFKAEGGRSALASPDNSGKGYRLTYFDDRGPVGHTVYNSAAEAIRDGMRNGYEPVDRGGKSLLPDGFAETEEERYRSERAGPQYSTRPEQPTMAPKDYDPLDDLSYQVAQNSGGSPPGVVARRAMKMMPTPENGIPEKILGAVTKLAIMPRTLASMDGRSAPFWRAWQDKDETVRSLQHRWAEASQGYAALTAAQRDKLSAVEEIDRLGGTSRPDTGRQIVARNETLTRTRMSRPGDSVVLDPATTKAYHERRAMFRDMWETIMRSAAIKQWPKGVEYSGTIDPAEIQAMADASPVKALTRQLTDVANLMASMQEQRNQAYVPFMRFGDYYIAFRPKPGTAGAAAMNWDGSGFPPTAWFDAVDSKSSNTLLDRLAGKTIRQGAVPEPAADLIAELRKSYPEDQYDLESDYFSNKPGVLEKLNIPALERMFIALQQKDSKLFAPMVEDLRNKMYEELRAGFKKKSDNVPGYSTDFPRATGAYIGWLSNHAAELQHGDAIRTAQEMWIDKHPDKEVRRYWEKWTDYQNNPAEEMQKLRQFGFYWQLAANPASTLSVLLHGPIVAHTTLGIGTGYAAAGRHLYGAFGEALRNMKFDAKVGAHIDMEKMGRTPAERALVKDAVGTGLVHSNMAEDLRGLGQNQAELMGIEPNRWKKVLNVLSSNISVADQLNRVGVLLGGYRLASQPGMLDKIAKTWGDNQVFRETMEKHGLTPENVAKFMVDEGLFVWGKRNRAPLQRGFGALLFQFKNFEVNYLGALHKFMTRMGPEGKVAGTLMLTGLGVLGGALAQPFTEDMVEAADWMGKQINGIDPMIESKIYQLMENAGMSKQGAEAMLRGPARSMLGIDLNSRLGMGEVISRNLSPLNALGTVPSMMANRISSAWNRAHHGQYAAAAAEMLPTAVRNVVKAAGMSQRGLETQFGNTVVPKASVTSGALAATALGFEPTSVARAYEERDFQRRAGEADAEARSRLTSHVVDLEEKIVEANKANDQAAADKLRQQIRDVYQANPDVKVSREAVRRGLQKRLDPQAAARRATQKKAPDTASPYPGLPEPEARATGGAVLAAVARVDRNPTDPQKHAGNYRKGHVRLHGMEIAIENPKGSFRTGHGADGKPWKSRLASHYGYFRRTEGADGDQVDCFLGPDLRSNRVFVIDQKDLRSGAFDEHKVMLGFPNMNAALFAYKNSFSDKRGEHRVGNVRTMTIAEFKDWIRNGDTTRSIAA